MLPARSLVTVSVYRSTLRQAAAPDFRIFHVDTGADLTLDNVTVSGGLLTGVDESGGGVFSRGTLTLTNSALSGHQINVTNYGYGGAIYSLGSVYLDNSTVSGNGVTGDLAYGGGVFSEFLTPARFDYSEISGNTVTGNYVGGAGLEALGSTTISHSTVAGNTAYASGGMYPTVYGVGVNASNGLTLTASTVSGNYGYSVGIFTINLGGGLKVDGIVPITNSTISGNVLSSPAAFGATSGGGIHHTGTGTIALTTLANNASISNYSSGGGLDVNTATVSLVTSVLGANIGGNCSGTLGAGTQTSLADDTTCNGIPTGLTLLDTALADNGGPTQTHALLAGSTAIDLAGDCGPNATDQRGVMRDDLMCDAGAYEVSDCLAPDGYTETLSNEMIADDRTIEVCWSVTLGPELTLVGPTGRLTLKAGREVIFMNDTVIEDGTELTVEIDSGLNM